jgi:hypothetical protein
MSSDDDETPPRGKVRPGSHWGDADRALASQTRRKLEQSRSYPKHEADDAVTAPLDLLLDSDLEPDDTAAINRLRRDSSDPYEQLWRLTKGFTREKERERSASRQIEGAVIAAIKSHDDTMVAMRSDLRDLQRSWKSARLVVGIVLTTAIGSLGTGIGLMLSRASDDGAAHSRMQRLEQDVQQLLQVRYQPKDKP